MKSESPRPSKQRRRHGTRVALALKVKQTTGTTVGVKAPVAPATTTQTSQSGITSPPSVTPTTPTTTTTTTAPTSPTIAYTAVDPTFTQNPTDGLQVTYTVSASAAATNSSGQTINLGAAGELPAGVLNFYNQGILACSLNVGGSRTSGPCMITYPRFGTYSVVTEYLPSGATPVTETDQETISPLNQPTAAPTLTFVAATYGTGYIDPTLHFGYFSGYDVTLAAATGNPEAPEYTETLTDTTTGESSTQTAIGSGPSVTLSVGIFTADFNGAGNTVPAGDVYIAGLGNIPQSDVVQVSVSTSATQDYAASPASASVQVWPLS